MVSTVPLGHLTTRVKLHQFFLNTSGVKSAQRQKEKILKTVYR